ncbi:MAG: hypothetical protein H0X02_11550 [Nitrosomonas sp.]|nr:hypothetical protein [Nitrosomonas sp.]
MAITNTVAFVFYACRDLRPVNRSDTIDKDDFVSGVLIGCETGADLIGSICSCFAVVDVEEKYRLKRWVSLIAL